MSDFLIPTGPKPAANPSNDFAIPVRNEPVAPSSDFAIPPVARPADNADFVVAVDKIIKESPKPDWSKATFEKADALNGIFKMPFPQAMQAARVLQDTKDPKVKTLGQAVADRWTAEKLTVQLGQLGSKMMESAGDPVKLAELMDEYDILADQLPGLEDVEPAYPDGFFGDVVSFGRRALTGAAGLVSQQAEMIGGKEQYDRYIEGQKDPKKFLKNMLLTSSQFLRGTGEIEGGAAFVDLVKAGVDPAIALPWAKGIGAINNAVEVAQIALLIKAFPGAGAVIEKATSAVTRNAILGPIMRNAAVKAGAKVIMGTAGELAQEVAQEATTFFGENFAIELNNAVKGTELEGNQDFLGRAKALVKDFLPGVLLMGGVSVGASSMRSAVTDRAKAEAKPSAVPVEAPAPVVVVAREEVAKALEGETKNVEQARMVAEQAATEQADVMANAETLTSQMVNDAVEIAEMQDAVEEEAAANAPFEDVSEPSASSKFGIKLPEMTEAETAEWDKFAEELRGEAVETPVETAPLTSEQARASTESGQWVDDADLGRFSTEPWARDELSSREDLRDLASYLADTGSATAFDTFVAEARQIDTDERSDEYYRGIWDTAPKAETVVDQDTQTVDEEAEIDKHIEAEVKAAKKSGPKVDQWIAELDKAGPVWSPKTETVREILDAKPTKATASEATEDLATTEIANAAITTKQKLVKRLIRDFLKPPGAGVGADAYDAILALQAPYTVKETKSLAKMQKAVRDWQERHPGAALVPEAQEILERKSIKDLPASELIDLYRRQKDIRAQGTQQERERRAKIKARRIQMATDLLADIPGGVAVERLAEEGSIATQEQEKKLAKKGKFKFDKVHPLRLFESMGGKFKDVFWNTRKEWEGREIVRENMHDGEIRALYTKHGIRPIELLKKAGDSGYYIDTLLYYYGQMKEPDGRRAVLWGNDENETRITRAIAELPQKYRDFMDDLQTMFNEHRKDSRKVEIEQNGRASPDVRYYLPMRREQDFGTVMAAELSTDASIRANARIAGLQKGFTKQRVTFKEGTQQARIRTDLLNILSEQIAKESRYVAGEEWARDMGWLLGGKSKESRKLLEAMKQKWGKPSVTWVQNYVNAVVKPESFNGSDMNGFISRVFRGMNDAALMFKLSTLIVQAEGPFRSLAGLDFKQWNYVFNGLFRATFDNKRASETMYEKSPVMKALAEAEAIDPALRQGKAFRHAKTNLGLVVQQARKAMKDAGYAGLQVANKWTITAEWTALYNAEMKKTGDEAQAVQTANDGVYKHQPSGNLADAPQMYWNAKQNIIKAYLLRFSRATNQTAQMLFGDLPKNLKEGKIGKAAGAIMAFAIGAALNGMRRRKRLPENAEEMLEDGIMGFADALDPITYGAAGVAIDTFRGKRTSQGEIKPLESVYMTARLARELATGEIDKRQIWDTISLLGQMGGLPTPAAENVFRTFYDPEGGEARIDLMELIGRRPKE